VSDADGGPTEDDLALARYGAALADGIEAALPGWVERSAERLIVAWSGVADPLVVSRAAAAGRDARDDVAPRVRALLAEDLDEQRTTPLALVRQAVRYPTAVLAEAGVPPVERDALAVEQHPADDYDLTPATFADLDPALHEPGLEWGAAKAHVHLQRHRPAAGGGS
jgi:hypothetical protein